MNYSSVLSLVAVFILFGAAEAACVAVNNDPCSTYEENSCCPASSPACQEDRRKCMNECEGCDCFEFQNPITTCGPQSISSRKFICGTRLPCADFPGQFTCEANSHCSWQSDKDPVPLVKDSYARYRAYWYGSTDCSSEPAVVTASCENTAIEFEKSERGNVTCSVEDNSTIKCVSVEAFSGVSFICKNGSTDLALRATVRQLGRTLDRICFTRGPALSIGLVSDCGINVDQIVYQQCQSGNPVGLEGGPPEFPSTFCSRRSGSCLSGTERTCQVGDVSLKAHHLDSACILSEEGTCVNDQTGDATDTGCTDDSPRCLAALGEAGTECTLCMNDKTGDEVDTGCNSSKPLCLAVDGEPGSQCAFCLNDKTGNATDMGCPDSAPLCIAGSGEPGTTCALCVDAQTGEPGTECTLCVNDQTGDAIDTGCPVDAPLCLAAPDERGDECVFCFNDKRGSAKDMGCSDKEPLCVSAPSESGTECAFCVNDQMSDATDTGCTDDSPICLAGLGEAGIECAFCVNDQGGNVSDTGCTVDFDQPLCEALPDEPGIECRKCINDQTGDNIDTGCSLELPECRADNQGQFGDECVPVPSGNPGTNNFAFNKTFDTSSVKQGSSQIFTLSVTKDDKAAIDDVVVEDKVSPFLTVTGITLAEGQGKCDKLGQLVSCAVSLPINKTATIKVNYIAAEDSITGDESQVYEVTKTGDGSLFMFLFKNGSVLRGSTVGGSRGATIQMGNGDETALAIDGDAERERFLAVDRSKKGSKNSIYLGEPLNFAIHVSCSDPFPGGWGKKDGPNEGDNADWQIMAYFIIKRKGRSKNKKTKSAGTCGSMLNKFEIQNVATASFVDPNSKQISATTSEDRVTIEAPDKKKSKRNKKKSKRKEKKKKTKTKNRNLRWRSSGLW